LVCRRERAGQEFFFPKACKIVLRVEHVFLVVVDPMGNHVGRAMCRLMLLVLGVYL
jgi:hypothetical protein